jgi:hypothetical protein
LQGISGVRAEWEVPEFIRNLQDSAGVLARDRPRVATTRAIGGRRAVLATAQRVGLHVVVFADAAGRDASVGSVTGGAAASESESESGQGQRGARLAETLVNVAGRNGAVVCARQPPLLLWMAEATTAAAVDGRSGFALL